MPIKTRVYGKLVRDHLPQVLKDEKRDGVFITLDDASYREQLDKKLMEELLEYYREKDDSKKVIELCDLVTVIDAILDVMLISPTEFMEICARKLHARGGLANGTFLVSESYEVPLLPGSGYE